MFYLIEKKTNQITGFTNVEENSEEFYSVAKEIIDSAAIAKGTPDIYGKTWIDGQLGDEKGSEVLFLDTSDYIRRLEKESFFKTLQVTVNGKVFDADDKSQQRILTALAFMKKKETKMWKLADNTIQEVTREELEEVLKVAIQAMSEYVVGEVNEQ